MAYVFYLDEVKLLEDPNGAARACYDYAWRLNFEINWEMRESANHDQASPGPVQEGDGLRSQII